MNQTDKSILFVTHTSAIGGPANSLMMLACHLNAYYRIAVLLPEDGPLVSLLGQEDIQTYIIPGLHKESIPRIYNLIRRDNFNVVYGNTPSNCSRNAMLATKLARRIFIWHFRTEKWHWTRVNGFFLRWADAVVAVSKACADSLSDFYPREKIFVVYNGVDLSVFDIEKEKARRELARHLHLNKNARLITSVAHLIPEKGHDQALNAFVQLEKYMRNIHLLFVGSLDWDIAYVEKIRSIIYQLGLEHCVHLLGFRDDVPNILCASDVYLHTSPREAHPRSVIEAMAARLPVVAYGVGGIVETIRDGDSGYLRPLGDVSGLADSLEHLLKNPKLALEMGRRGREIVEKQFTAERTAYQIAQVIKTVLNK